MKIQTVLVAGLTAGLATGLAIGVSQWQMATAQIMPARLSGLTIPLTAEKTVAATAMGKMPEGTMAKAKNPVKVLMMGKFVKAEHPTTGGASVVMKDGKQYLMLDQQFKSDSGPDLKVLLHREATPKNYTAADYVNLGPLKQVAGAQVYEIPAGMDVAEYKSAVIWCQEFNATFGFAMLK
jgi:Electron transfer DM13